MACYLVIVVMALQAFGQNLVVAEKRYGLSVLNFVLLTGQEPKNGKHCREAVNMVYDFVNKRQDILPEYEVKAYFVDEGPNSMTLPKELINYERSFDNQTTNVYRAPVTSGGAFTPGCKALGSMLHHVNMVGIVSACLSPSFTGNRVLYPNMYRSLAPAEKAVQTKLAFIKNIGKWSKIAVLVNAINPLNTALATKLMEGAQHEGISIAWFDSVLSVDESTIMSLKASGLRIISIELSEGYFLFQFFCSAYRYGLKGHRYRFMILMAAFFDPTTLPPFVAPDCPKSVILEQFQITYFIGASTSSLANYGNTTLGYDREGFNKAYENYSTGERKPDYGDRYLCHDYALQTLLALDGTERTLAKRNITLRDMKAHPREIMKTANISVANVNLFGVRTGRMKYSENLEYETDLQFIASWSPSIGINLFYRISGLYNSTHEVLQHLEQVSPMNWRTPDGQAPFDEARQSIVNETISLLQFSVITSIAALLCFATLLWGTIVAVNYCEQFLPISKLCLTVGFLLTEGGAVTFLADSNTEVVCNIRILLSVLGVSLINGVICSNLLNLMKMYNQFAIILLPQARKMASLNNNVYEIEAQRTSEVAKVISSTQQKAILGVLAFALLNVVLLVSCLVTSPMTAMNMHLPKSTSYDELNDIVYRKFTNACHSEDFPNWIGAITAVNFAFLISGLFAAYQLRRAAILLKSAFPMEIKHLQIGVVNATAIQLITVFILVTKQDEAVSQQLVVAVAELILVIMLAVPVLIAFLISVAKPLPTSYAARRSASMFTSASQLL